MSKQTTQRLKRSHRTVRRRQAAQTTRGDPATDAQVAEAIDLLGIVARDPDGSMTEYGRSAEEYMRSLSRTDMGHLLNTFRRIPDRCPSTACTPASWR